MRCLKMKKIALAVFVIASMVVISSCVTQSPAVSSQYVGSERYAVTGSYTALLNCTMFEADKAIRATAKRARFTENLRANRQNFMEYEYQDIYDGKVGMRLEETAEGPVKLVIRVGKLGDRNLSQQLLQGIDDELHAMKDSEF